MDITEEMYKAAKKLADDWKDHVEPNAAFDRFTLAHACAVVEQYEREQAKRCGSIVVGYDEGTADDTAYREPRCWMPNCNGTCKHAQADETAAPPAPPPSEPENLQAALAELRKAAALEGHPVYPNVWQHAQAVLAAITSERERADRNAADAADKECEVERLKAENERLGKMTKKSFGEECALEDVIRFEMEPGVRSNERPAAKAIRIMRLQKSSIASLETAVADKEREARVEFRKVYERLSNALPNGTFGENVVGVACRELQQIAGLRAQVADLQTALTLERERADRNAADAADLARLREIWTTNRWMDSVEHDAILSSNKKVRG